MTKRHLRILEFLVIGIGFGLAEDLIAIAIATDAKLDFRVFIIVLAVAIPFAFISEIVVDHPRFWDRLFKTEK